ncbi:MAG: hypothetical protein ACREJ3_14285 [Polyangiaceae bacterium]
MRRSARRPPVPFALALALTWGCGIRARALGDGSIIDASSSDGSGVKSPRLHRPVPVACPPTSGEVFPGAVNGCDKCFSDSDCEGGVCACGGGPVATGCNSCVVSECRVDADCSEGGPGFCSPSVFTSCAPDNSGGYFCRTSADECDDSTACPSGTSCVYVCERGHWGCGHPVAIP